MQRLVLTGHFYLYLSVIIPNYLWLQKKACGCWVYPSRNSATDVQQTDALQRCGITSESLKKKRPKVAKIIIAKVAKAAKAKGPKKDQKWPETARNGIMWVKKR